MVDVITYYFLSDDTELHRCNMAKVKKHAMRHHSPLVRWWLMFALESATEALLSTTRGVAEAAEQEWGVTLNYWANRRGLNEPARAAGSCQAFLLQRPSQAELDTIAQVIDTVFDNFEQQFGLSEFVARTGGFVASQRSLPPPRVSLPVERTPPDLLPGWASAAANG
jgi:hypothetical protein